MMDQAELLALVAKGKEAWNKWADTNPDAKVDFSAVEFDRDVTFEGFRFPKFVTFNKATFTGDADFRKATFTDTARFSEATFTGDADFRKASFTGTARFIDTTFSSTSDLSEATFSGDADFRKATFSGSADFSKAMFTDDVHLQNTIFSSTADLSMVTFSGIADVSEATFSNTANFRNAAFKGEADFVKTKFSGDTDFIEAIFLGITSFNEATFSGTANFSEATFSGTAYFIEAKFIEAALFISLDVQIRIDFEDAKFHRIPDFHAAKNTELIALGTVEFSLSQPSGLLNWIVYRATGLCDTDRSTMLRVRQIRGIAAKAHAIDSERDLTILERNAQVGTAWSDLKTLRPFNQWLDSLSTALFSTPLLLLYRWSSDYGRSIKRPLALLMVSPFFWYAIYLKLYIGSKLPNIQPLNSEKLSALQNIAVSSALPIGTALRPTYITATQTLFSGSGALPLPFQIALLLQNVTGLVLLFLIGLALRNYFRMK